MPLTYREAGVDIEVKTKAKEEFEEWVVQSYNDLVLTSPGHFGGAIRLEKEKMHLCGSLGWKKTPSQIIKQTEENLEGSPLAFLDYIASSSLNKERVLNIVKYFCKRLKVPLIGGETAEMPHVFKEKEEVVGALFGLGEKGVPLPVDDYENPMLVFSIDGVGTKTRLALQTDHTEFLLHDLIHHSLNDILCLSAKGVGFLLYIGCHSKEDVPHWEIEKVFSEKKLSLLKYEIVEKPELYQPGEIDLCGAIAGIAEEEQLYCSRKIQEGDVLVGLPSNGLHTNGYSLAQKVLQQIESPPSAMIEALLLPHVDYSSQVLPILSSCKGIAHITGGGIGDNLARTLPDGLGAKVMKGSWPVPPVFSFIQERGKIPLFDPVQKGMYETFNMGIGMILVMDEKDACRLSDSAYLIGSVVQNHRLKPHERILFS